MVACEDFDTHSRTLYEANGRVGPSRVSSIYDFFGLDYGKMENRYGFLENPPKKVLDRTSELCLYPTGSVGLTTVRAWNVPHELLQPGAV